MSNIDDGLPEPCSGDGKSAEELLPLVYAELRKLALSRLARERSPHQLDATDLVHEVYLRLTHADPSFPWKDSRQFFAAAAEAMRRILIERARQRKSLKRGGNHQRVDMELTSLAGCEPMAADDLLMLNEALDRLAVEDPRKAQLVKLRFFAGLTVPQAADVLGISVATAENDWTYARCWLRLAMPDYRTP
jgi:RNA polymerase sigma factor (TIGR02999 family)